ncbi:hypothetical protein RAAC3_TM7C00001G0111 [Candidatus Saccharibacteria bacterium RAAC3_TM7_1]|nr:hypothetical protein RAAC3_TM7C00001G0111 [Candidatus Saccharibacteria bacterium RAAC3_TM7_1]HCZ28236.1 hypothetical protein [Candidatus Saccharibacteria bacterium]
MRNMPATKRISSGFTLVEMLIIAPIVILFIGGFVSLLVALTGDSLKRHAQNIMTYETQAALEDIETNAAKATSFLMTTGTLQDKQGKGDTGGTAFTNTSSGAPDTLIFTSPATTKNPYDATRGLVYTGSGTCDSTKPVYAYTSVYFVNSSGTIYKRTILPTGSTCATPYQQGSCSEAIMSSSPPAYCQVKDEQLLSDVTDFSVQYLDSSGASIASSNATEAKAVNISISTSKSVAGKVVSYTGSSQSAAQGLARITNLATNPSFENNTTGWNALGGSTFTQDASWSVTGSKSALLTASSGSNDSAAQLGGYDNATFAIQPNTTYTLSAYGKIVSPGTGTPIGNGSRQVTFWVNNGSTYTVYRGNQIENTAGATGRSSVTFTTPSTITQSFIRLYFGYTGGSMQWDGVMLSSSGGTYTYADGNSNNWAWNGTANNSTSTGPPLTTNLHTNPSFESNISGWGQSAYASTARVTGSTLAGNAYFRISRSAAGDAYAYYTAPTVPPPNSAYTLSFWAWADANVTVTDPLMFRTNNDGACCANIATKSGQTLTTAPTKITLSGITGSNPTSGLQIILRATPTIGQNVYYDGFMMVEGSSSYNYADGSSANWAWSGTANNSTSTGPAF